MIITTTPSIEGHPVKEYKGIVTSEVIIGANAIRDFMAGIRDFFGGRSRTYEQVFAEARFNAFREIEQHAVNLGGNAVVGVRLSYENRWLRQLHADGGLQRYGSRDLISESPICKEGRNILLLYNKTNPRVASVNSQLYRNKQDDEEK